MAVRLARHGARTIRCGVAGANRPQTILVNCREPRHGLPRFTVERRDGTMTYFVAILIVAVFLCAAVYLKKHKK